MSRVRSLAFVAGFFCLVGFAGCGINPQPEPPSAQETDGAAGDFGIGGNGGEGGHRAADPDGAADAMTPPGSGLLDGGNKRSGEFSNDDPSAQTDYNGAFENLIDAGAPDADAGTDRDATVTLDQGDEDERPYVPEAGLGSVSQ